MNGIDLNLFQFDFDQTWAVMFFRHDGSTVLARYGTRGDKDGMKYNSMASFTESLRRILQVDKNWTPEMQPFYDGKRGPKAKHATVDEIPSETIRKIKAQEERGKNTKQTCIHCHNVYDARRDFEIAKGEYDPSKHFKYPLPLNAGLHVDDLGQLQTRIPNSPEQGFGPPNRVLRIDGQNIHTMADIQFALHQVSDPGEVTIETVSLQRGDPETVIAGKVTTHEFTFQLPAGWKASDIGWRASMYGMPPKPGLWVEAMGETEKVAKGIAKDKLALKVRGVFGEEVRRDGLKKDDVIVQFGDETSHHSEGQFHASLRLNYYKPNSKLQLKLIRGGKPTELTVTFANK